MPLCPQITNTPITVTLTADFTVTDVVPVLPATTEQLAVLDAEVVAADAAAAAAAADAAAAAAAAGAAQADATEALADAAVAYNAAVGSLQPSASTIVNASNQMTAINSGGITVYSGASSSSGARVVLNSTGLAGFNSGGTATFSVSASTGAAVFSGSVTGATITGGTLNIAGNAIINASGLLTATGATITGEIRATAGYFGTAANGFSISSTGLVGVGAGTIVGGAISGTTFTNGSTFSVTSAGVLTATSGSIAGFTLTASTITNGSTMTLYNNGDFYTGGVVSAGNGLYAQAGCFFGSTLSVTGTSNFTGTLTGVDIRANGDLFAAGHSTTTNAPQAVVFQTGGRIARSTSSSERYKENIVDLSQVPELNPKKLLDLPVRAFTYKEGELPETDDRHQQLIPGFIAEEVDAIYPVAADYVDGPESWNDRMIVPALLSLVQDLYKEVQILKGE